MNTSAFRKKSILRSTGLALMCAGAALLSALVLFYGTVLFVRTGSPLEGAYSLFRMLFSVEAGIVFIWAVFFAIGIPAAFMVLYGARLWFGTHLANKQQRLLMLSIWILAVVSGSIAVVQQFGVLIDRIEPFSSDPLQFSVVDQIPLEVKYVFKSALRSEVQKRIGTPVEGYEPYMFLDAFPGLTESDFEGVQASIGYYTMRDGSLAYQTDNTKLIHSAAKAITDRGMDRLLANVSVRLGVDLAKDGTLTQIMESLMRSATTSTPGA